MIKYPAQNSFFASHGNILNKTKIFTFLERDCVAHVAYKSASQMHIKWPYDMVLIDKHVFVCNMHILKLGTCEASHVSETNVRQLW